MMDSLGRDLVAYAVLMALIALAGSPATTPKPASGSPASSPARRYDGDV